jgi:hypothetical protein
MTDHGIDPYIAFNHIPFKPTADGGEMTDWVPHPVWAKRKVAGSSTIKRRFMQYDADTLELRVLVAGKEDYFALLDAIGTEAELVLIPAATMLDPDGRQFHEINSDYVRFPATTLIDVQKTRPLRDGRALCTLRFEREHEEGAARWS